MDGDHLGNRPGWLSHGKESYELEYDKANAKSNALYGMDYPTLLNEMVANLIMDSNNGFKQKFGKLTDNAERVDLCFRNDYLHDVFSSVLDLTLSDFEYRKKSDRSIQYRYIGNEAFCRDNFPNSVYNYTFAILYAPNSQLAEPKDCPELALAFGNRSAAFYHMKEYESCIFDIDSALANGYQQRKCTRKLLVRKVEALIALNQFAEAKKLLDQIDPIPDDDRCQAMRIELIGMLDPVYQPKPIDLKKPRSGLLVDFYRNCTRFKPSPLSLRSSLSQKVEIGYNETKGRHIRCGAEPIEPGDVLVAELPYSCVLLEPFEQQNCHHCCRKLQVCLVPLVPCRICSKVLYCSSECQKESWSLYHQFECPYLHILYSIGVGHLAFRLLLVTGLGPISESISEDLTTSVDKPGSEFESIYSLVHNSDKFPFSDLIQYSATCSLLLQLAIRSGFISPDRTKNEIRVVGGMLLRFMLQLVSNAHSVSHLISDDEYYDLDLDDEYCSKFSDTPVATALYPTLSLLNHCCEPNITTLFEPGEGTFAKIVATRRIEPGEEVTTCYRVHWARFDYARRQSMLSSQYFFECRCSACLRECWGDQLRHELNLSDLFAQYNNELASCPNCHSWACLTLVATTTTTSNDVLLGPQSKSIVCSKCDSTISRSMIEKRFAKIRQHNKQINQLISRIDARLKLVDTGLGSHETDQERKLSSVATDLSQLEIQVEKLSGQLLCPDKCLSLGKLYDQLSYYHYAARLKPEKATLYCERNVHTVQCCFGPDSIELCYELIKLADLHWLRVNSHLEKVIITEPSSRAVMEKCDEATVRAITLLQVFALGSQPDDDSSYLAKQISRFNRRLRDIRTDFASSSNEDDDDFLADPLCPGTKPKSTKN